MIIFESVHYQSSLKIHIYCYLNPINSYNAYHIHPKQLIINLYTILQL
jgi:hypothetical protein